MKVKDVMTTKFPKIYENDSIDEAIKLIIKIPESSLPVFNKRGKVLGELSQKELLLIDIGDKEFRDEEFNFEQIKKLLAKDAKKVKDLMSLRELSVSPDEDVLTAAKMLYEEGISMIPVLDKRKKLLGIVSEISILKHYKKILKNGR